MTPAHGQYSGTGAAGARAAGGYALGFAPDPHTIAPSATMDWYRPDPGFETDNGSVITVAKNRIAGREDIGRVLASAPVFTASDAAFGGRPTFSPAVTGSKNLFGTTASRSNYLHNGVAGCTVMIVVMPTSTAAFQFLWSTIGASGVNVGAFMNWPTLGTLRWGIGNGASVVIQCDDASGSFTLNQPHVVIATYSPALGAHLYVDGLLRKATAQLNAPSAANATNPLGVGGNGAGAFQVDCRVAEWYACDTDYSGAANIDALFAYAKARYFAGVALATVDFTGDTPGAATTPRGTSFARSVTSTAQLSATTVSGNIAANTIRIGSDGVRRGALIEESRTNLLLHSRNLTASWGANGTVTATGFTAPDGTTVSTNELQSLSGVHGRVQAVASVAGKPYSASAWCRAPAGTGNDQAWVGNAAVVPITYATSTTWQRKSATQAAASTTEKMEVGDGTDQSGSGGLTAGARDSVWDMAQLEAGAFPTEFQLTTVASATRTGEQMTLPNGAWLIGASGRLSFEWELQPKGASGEYSANMRLFTIDANNYAEVDFATGAIIVKQGGVAYTTPVAMAWARGDTLGVSIEAGGGALATRVEYRLNGGAAVKLSTGNPPTQGAFAPGGGIDILCSGTASQFSCWFRKFMPYPDGAFASWVV